MSYSAYRPIDELWLTTIPKHWRTAKISELFSERNIKVSDTDFAPLSVSKGGVVPQIATVAKSNAGDNRKLVRQGDFVINSRSDRRGSSGVSQYDGSVSLINIVLEPRKEENGHYYHYLLRSHYFIEEYYRNGRGIVADLWTTRYTEMKIIYLPVPPRNEQDQIVRFLDWKVSRIDKFINAKRKQIELLMEQKRAVINDAVIRNRKKIRLKYIAKLYPSCDTSRLTDESIVTFAPMECVRTGNLRIQEEKFKKYEASYNLFQNNDILLAKVTPCFENSNLAIADDLVGGVGFGSSELFVLRCFTIDTKCLFYLLQSTAFINFGRSTMNGVAGLKRVSATKMMDYQVPILSISEQQAIVEYLYEQCGSIDKIVDKLNDEIALFTEYRTRLISDVVTGKVDVHDVVALKHGVLEDV
jgi:type I restriction enzyme S subunit